MSPSPTNGEPQQHIRGLRPACDAILARLEQISAANPIVGITGPVASGKSTLADLVASACGGSVLSTDRYLPDYADIAPHQRDDPAHSDLPRLRSDLRSLAEGRDTAVPVWSFHAHRRVGEEPVRASGPLICEGLFALHTEIADALDVRVYVEAPPAVRWDRWEAIERSGERGWGVERAREHFEAVAEPEFARWSSAYRRCAHLIVTNEQHADR